jgi:error-prone DNA polymerase
MPEQPEKKRAVVLEPGPPLRAGYAELHCKTNFSFLEGASHPDELVARAAELGYHALAITDRNSLAGVVRAHAAAKQVGLKLLIGAEIHPTDAPPVVLLATDRAAYGRLARLITRGRRKAEKGACQITFDDIAEYSAGLLAGVLGAPGEYREVFGDRCYQFVSLHHEDNERMLEKAVQAARRARVPLVATGGVRFHVPERRPLADVLTAIGAGRAVAECGELLEPNAERYLKTAEQIKALFPAELIRRTLEVAERCTFQLDELRYDYPEELAPRGETPLEYLIRLTWEGARNR